MTHRRRTDAPELPLAPITLTHGPTQPHKRPRDRQQATQQTRPVATAACGGCDRRWTGTAQAHCGRCHATFSSPRNFDEHRRDGYCRPPSTARRDNGQPIFTARESPYGTTYISYRDPDAPTWYTVKDEDDQ
jgi:hypothetical protein